MSPTCGWDRMVLDDAARHGWFVSTELKEAARRAVAEIYDLKTRLQQAEHGVLEVSVGAAELSEQLAKLAADNDALRAELNLARTHAAVCLDKCDKANSELFRAKDYEKRLLVTLREQTDKTIELANIVAAVRSAVSTEVA